MFLAAAFVFTCAEPRIRHRKIPQHSDIRRSQRVERLDLRRIPAGSTRWTELAARESITAPATSGRTRYGAVAVYNVVYEADQHLP